VLSDSLRVSSRCAGGIGIGGDEDEDGDDSR
jgi:hypothetical protein